MIRRRRLAEAERQRDEATQRADEQTQRAERAEADAAELRHKYEQPVTVRKVVSGGAFESKRRKH